MSKYDLVFLDADETLFDFKRAESEALSGAFGQFGLEASGDTLRDYEEINKRLWAALERGEIDQTRLKVERFGHLFKKMGADIDPEAFSRAYIELLSRGAFLLDGAESVCEYLGGKYTLAIITNGIKEVQLPRIGGSAIRRHISRVIVSEEARHSKPSKEIFDYACNAIGFHRKERMIMVGDSLASDIQGGINFGIDTCWANLASARNETGIAPTYEIRKLEELKGIL